MVIPPSKSPPCPPFSCPPRYEKNVSLSATVNCFLSFMFLKKIIHFRPYLIFRSTYPLPYTTRLVLSFVYRLWYDFETTYFSHHTIVNWFIIPPYPPKQFKLPTQLAQGAWILTGTVHSSPRVPKNLSLDRCDLFVVPFRWSCNVLFFLLICLKAKHWRVIGQ